MKKIILTVAAVFAFSFANAQDGGFKAGVNLGLPVGEINDWYSSAVAIDVAYTWKVAAKFDMGVTTGYAHYIGKVADFQGFKLDFDDAGFVPIAATAQYSITNNLFVGTDLGYAFSASADLLDGGFIFQPKFGYQTDKFELYAGIKHITAETDAFSSVNLGFNYKF